MRGGGGSHRRYPGGAGFGGGVHRPPFVPPHSPPPPPRLLDKFVKRVTHDPGLFCALPFGCKVRGSYFNAARNEEDIDKNREALEAMNRDK